MIKVKEEDKRCGNCKHWDSDMCYCPLHPEEEKWEEDYCDDWEDDNKPIKDIIKR